MGGYLGMGFRVGKRQRVELIEKISGAYYYFAPPNVPLYVSSA